MLGGEGVTKLERAKAIIEKARAIGCEAKVQERWVVFQPPLPVDLLMDSVDLGDELVEALSEDERKAWVVASGPIAAIGP